MAEIEGPAPEAGAPSAEAALEAGDLTTALELARAARTQTPSADTWEQEARVCEALGDFSCASFAYGRAVDQLEQDADADRISELEALRGDAELAARGAVESEGESTHREDIDAARVERMQEAMPPEPPAPAVADKTVDNRIWRKWYFWLTVGTIVSGAVAVTAIAITAAADDRPDALDRSGRSSMAPGGLGFRF